LVEVLLTLNPDNAWEFNAGHTATIHQRWGTFAPNSRKEVQKLVKLIIYPVFVHDQRNLLNK
jgi:hypothetical protein